MSQIRLVVIVGPTAVGKTALAIQLAEKFDGEIVSADSRQIYQYMDIGTAKPTTGERARVPHHLLDVVAPDQTLSVAQYQQRANATIHDIAARGKLPFLVGGTGQYIKAVLEGWHIPTIAPQPELRRRLEADWQTYGVARLYAELQRVDPAGAPQIDAQNPRRIIRALEVFYATGQSIITQRAKTPPPYQTLQIGLTLSRAKLYRRIEERVDTMLAQGFVDEVKQLLARGYNETLPALSGFGYQHIAKYLRDELTLAETTQQIKQLTRRFVQKQYAWFPLDDPNILWLDAEGDVVERARQAMAEFLEVMGN
jgi:tRNA dimethylallyltransferase